MADGMLHTVSLDDKYTVSEGRVLLTGIQALVRLPLMQRQRDAASGLNTAGFISGYRGSPLGGVDQALWKAQKHLDAARITFKPGINEDLAATAVWGTQQVSLSSGARHQGVFALWYGKGPGVDRSMDVIKHGNGAGSSAQGGVLLVTGDDHACKSSTFPHQSEQAYIAAMVPVLHAANVQDVLDLGLHGWAMSRFSGCWVALKLVSDVADATAVVDVSPARPIITVPTGYELPAGGLNFRWPDPPVQQEQRLITHKLKAAMAYARANQLNRSIFLSDTPRLGLIAPGKAYLDVRQALDELGLSEAEAKALGLSVFKVAMPWPLEPEGIKDFALKHPALLVVEEKRAVVEPQLKDILYHLPEGTMRPEIIGKYDLAGAPLLPEHGELSMRRLAIIIGQQLLALGGPAYLQDRIDALIKIEPQALIDLIERKPHYCSGCPHNSSTVVPAGSRALGGIGCHYMALWMERKTETFSQMGGEGVAWVGQAPFTDEKHVFANLGDGTYFHSGAMAIRAAIAGKVNITYKILYNDAVAMTGGQKVDGELSVADITHQLRAEGVKCIFVLSDNTKKYGLFPPFAKGTKIRHRDALESVQRELRETPGVTVLIFDQTCAAEKRRRRKRGKMVDPARRVIINELVCEGCGDCSIKSNCLSVVPLETEWGTKRSIDQSSCNKDFSCLKGFCPSFVTLEGAQLKKPTPLALSALPSVPEAVLPRLETPWNILVTGIGGTGIITIGALLAMAAHLDGKAASVLDQTGLAQKGGAVFSHVRLAQSPEHLHAVRLAGGSADLFIAGDLVVAASREGLITTNPLRTHLIANTHETSVADFTRNPDSKVPSQRLLERLGARCKPGCVFTTEATQLATALFGDTIAANLFLLGFAYQKGLVPLTASAIEKAIEMNAAEVQMNLAAFRAGRVAVAKPEALARPTATPTLSKDLDEIINRRIAFLTDYQDKAYAERYTRLVLAVRRVEREGSALAEAVARNFFKLMAYKDEYEVARLQTDEAFLARIKSGFTGNYRITFHLAPPIFPLRDNATGEPKKLSFGPWALPLFRGLAKLRRLRGTPFDPFGWLAERRVERQLIADYEALMTTLLPRLSPETSATITRIAALPEKIRGYGHIKQRHLEMAKKEEAELLAGLGYHAKTTPQSQTSA